MALADLAPGQHADRVRNHWWWRPGWHVGRRFYALHLTFDNQPDLHRLASAYRTALASTTTVTLIPDEWLHLTMQGIGFQDQIPPERLRRVADEASARLADIAPFTVDFRDVTVADEAIVLLAEPATAIQQLRAATRAAVARGLGRRDGGEDDSHFRPHVSIAYITAEGPASPYIRAIQAGTLAAARVRIDHVDLIEMHRDRRMYEWTQITSIPLGNRQAELPQPPPIRQPVVAAIVTSNLGVLVGKRNDGKPPWAFISGEIEPGESPADAVVREVKEETGLVVRAARREIGRRVHPSTGRTMIYLACYPVGKTDIFVGDEQELAEVRWVSLQEAEHLLPEMFEPVLVHLARELNPA